MYENGDDKREVSEEDSEDDLKPDEYNVETFRHALEDARLTHEQQLEAYNDVDEKGWRVLRFNGIIVTIASAGAVNIGLQAQFCAITLFIIGIGLLSISTCLTLVGQPEKEAILGLSKADFEKISNKNPAEPVYI